MNNKVLISSITSVVILILVSFTGVVGYQTTSSTIARASPLFSIRTSRAIDKESKDLTCDYVGKGEENIISISKRDNRIDMVQKAIDVMKRMDEKTFTRFVKLFVYQAKNYNKMKDINNNDIIDALYQIRDNPELLKNHFIVGKNDDSMYTKWHCDTVWPMCPFPPTILGEWIPQCYLQFIALILLIGGFLILFILGGILYSLCESFPLKTYN